MKKIKILKILLFSILLVSLLAFVGCKEDVKPYKSVMCEAGEKYDLTQLFEDEDSVVNVALKNPSGKTVDVQDGNVIFKSVGDYALTLSSGKTVKISVKDTQKPIFYRTNVRDFYYVGEEYDVGVACVDALDGVLDYTISITHNGQDVSVVDGKFTPTQLGDYAVYCTATDNANNAQEFSFSVTAQTRYELGSEYNFLIEGDSVAETYEVISEKSYLKTVASEAGFASIQLTGENLNPYSEYTVTVVYNVSDYGYTDEKYKDVPFEVLLSQSKKEEYIKGETTLTGDKTFTFEVTTNADGDFEWIYNSLRFNGAATVIWKSITLDVKADLSSKIAESYQFGQHKMTIKKGSSGTDFISLAQDNGILDGYYETRTLAQRKSGYVSLIMEGTGFEPNKYYTFTIYYDWAYSADNEYAFFILHDDNLAICTAWGRKSNTSVEYEVKTDEYGNYNAVFNHLSLKSMCRIKWLNIVEEKYEEENLKFSIYGADCKPYFYNGQYVYKLSTKKTLTAANNHMLVWVDGADDNVMYEVYAQIKHSYSVGSSNWGIQLSADNYVTKDGRYLLGVTSSVDDKAGNKHCFNITAIRDVLNGLDKYAIIYDITLVPTAMKVNKVNVSKAVGDTVNVSATGLGIGVYSGLTAADITFNVTKTVANATGADAKTVLSGDSFTVESGCFYEIEITATPKAGQAIYAHIQAPIKKYIYVYENSLITYNFDGSSQPLTLANNKGAHAETVTDEFGNKAYKIWNGTGANVTCNFVINKANLSGYKVYADFTVVSDNQTSQALSFNYNNQWPDVRGTGRCFIGTIDANGGFVQSYVLARLDGETNYVIMDNIVLVP